MPETALPCPTTHGCLSRSRRVLRSGTRLSLARPADAEPRLVPSGPTRRSLRSSRRRRCLTPPRRRRLLPSPAGRGRVQVVRHSHRIYHQHCCEAPTSGRAGAARPFRPRVGGRARGRAPLRHARAGRARAGGVQDYLGYLTTSTALCLALALPLAAGAAAGSRWRGASLRSLWLFGLVPLLGFAGHAVAEPARAAPGDGAALAESGARSLLIGLLIQISFALVRGRRLRAGSLGSPRASRTCSQRRSPLRAPRPPTAVTRPRARHSTGLHARLRPHRARARLPSPA